MLKYTFFCLELHNYTLENVTQTNANLRNGTFLFSFSYNSLGEIKPKSFSSRNAAENTYVCVCVCVWSCLFFYLTSFLFVVLVTFVEPLNNRHIFPLCTPDVNVSVYKQKAIDNSFCFGFNNFFVLLTYYLFLSFADRCAWLRATVARIVCVRVCECECMCVFMSSS